MTFGVEGRLTVAEARRRFDESPHTYIYISGGGPICGPSPGPALPVGVGSSPGCRAIPPADDDGVDRRASAEVPSTDGLPGRLVAGDRGYAA